MVTLSRRTAPLLRTIGNKPNIRTHGQEQEPEPSLRPETPPTDASPVSSDDECASESTVPGDKPSTLGNDGFVDIEDDDPAQGLPHPHKQDISRGRNNAAGVKQRSRTKKQSLTSPASSPIPSGSGKRKRGSSPNQSDPWELDVWSRGSQPKKTYQGRNASSQPKTQLHGPEVKTTSRLSSQSSNSTGVAFQKPPTLASETAPDKPTFRMPTVLQSPALNTSNPPQIFKLPRHFDDSFIDLYDDNDSKSSPLSSAPSDLSTPPVIDLIEDSQSHSTTATSLDTNPSTVPCPMCKQPVDRDFLQSFGNGKRLLSHQQLRFCQAHQQGEAEAQWVASRYPTIDWDNLDTRLQKLHSTILAVLEHQQPSVYRQQLEERIASGRSRKLLRDPLAGDEMPHCVLPGYFGPRGGRAMVEHVMGGFGRILRQTAMMDSTFKAVGVGGFVQAVLVPEIACRLVMEDMGVGVEVARGLLRESAAVGELLNKELEERIEDDDDDDDVNAKTEDGQSDAEELDNHDIDLHSDCEAQTIKVSSPWRKSPRKKRRKDIKVVDVD